MSGQPGALAENIMITDNIIHGEGMGIGLEDAANSIIQSNWVYVTTGWAGMKLTGISNQVVFNRVSGGFQNGIGVAGGGTYYDSTANTVAWNTVIGAGIEGDGDAGIHLLQGTSGNTIKYNNISGVDKPIVDDGEGNIIIS